MRRICIIVICLLVILSAQTAHGEMLPRNVTDALTPEAEEILRDLGDGGYDHGTLLRGLERIWGTVCQTFLHLFRGNVNGAVLLLGVVLLCGVIGDMGRAADSAGGNYVTLGGVLVITTITAGSLRSLMETGMEAMEQLDVFAKALLPTLAAAVAAGGGVVSASVRQVLTVLFTNLLITAIRTLLLPLVYCYVAAAVANAALPDHDLKRLQDGIGKVISGALTGLLVVFTAFLTLSGAAGTAADTAALRLTKSAISTAVPVVGGIIADATDSVLASAGILKSALGVFGMLGVLAICLTPFLHLAVQYLLYKMTAFLAATVGSEPLVELIDALGSAFGLLLAMTGTCALLLLISVASSVSVVVT